MTRMRHFDARKILQKHNEDLGLTPPSSSNPTKQPSNQAQNEEGYWAGVTDAMATTERSKAYLRAYTEIAGPMPIYGTGILLDAGWHMPLDKSVMHRLQRDGFVSFGRQGKKLTFEVSSKGQEWMKT